MYVAPWTFARDDDFATCLYIKTEKIILSVFLFECKLSLITLCIEGFFYCCLGKLGEFSTVIENC